MFFGCGLFFGGRSGEGDPVEGGGGAEGVGEAFVAEGAEVFIEELGDLFFALGVAERAVGAGEVCGEIDFVHGDQRRVQ
jgi:hypothetical protein